MTSIKDAWGVSDIGATTNHFQDPKAQEQHLSSHLVATSSQGSHPNSIIETRPTRIDVAVHCPKVINYLLPKSPEFRTHMVTDLIRAALLPPKKVVSDKKEYFEVTETNTDTGNETDNMTLLMLFTFVLILLDKLFQIWKNS